MHNKNYNQSKSTERTEPPRLAAAGNSSRRRDGGETRLSADHDRQQQLLAEIPDDGAREAIARFLVEQSTRDSAWHRLVSRFCGWRNGVATSGSRPIAWSAIAEGLNEILDVNEVGRRITPDQALAFVERSHRRAQQDNADGAVPFDTSTLIHDMAITYANQGDPQWLRYCEDNGIRFREEAVA